MNFAAQLIPYLSLLQRSLPEEASRSATRIIGKILASLQKARLRVAEKNLSSLGLEPDPNLAKRTIQNWTRSLSDQIRSLWVSRNELLNIVEVDGMTNLLKALDAHRGVILVTAHLGNYELAGSYIAAQGLPISAVTEEIPGEHTKAINRIRRRFGMGVIGYSNIPKMIETVREGKILVLLADRDLGGKGIKVKFGERLRRVPTGPAILALRSGALLQTGYFVFQKKERRYLCVINPAIDLGVSGSLQQKISLLTEAVTEELVAAIRSYPDQWFVFQDEWPSSALLSPPQPSSPQKPSLNT